MQAIGFIGSYWQQSLTIIGAFFLLASVFLVGRIIREVPKDSERSKWVSINVLVLFFLLAYVLYIILEGVGANTHAESLVPIILIAGAVFVYLVCRISCSTTIALKRAETLEIENITDSLTGVFNRRYLDRRLREECLLGYRHKYDSAVIMLDIDHFKRVNDVYGHQAGDVVLQQIGLALNSILRKTDVVARYGGEEFLVLLPRADHESAMLVAENIRKHIEQSVHQVDICKKREKKLIQVTASMGVASFSSISTEASPENMCCVIVDCADKALYAAKVAGRNRVSSWREVRCAQPENADAIQGAGSGLWANEYPA
ncbi:GGDEF domain-containing protein (plasmid) [Trichlorobacter lovleyi]|uniref:GGDEF domain-containing protein n=1 Tax=Trichlorobacter lovleyi TaxID=313985 RepID=UPI00223FDC0E|nr:GGDEF domain-containing protein [Trichlorobacter lovleyi]QOX80825.1 GGDEF domain-containing protein [Trichlorobacter lovleyi]